MDKIDIDIQLESDHDNIPTEKNLIAWAKLALERDAAEITIRIVDDEESSYLNKHYRNKSGPTNVLSFPLKIPFDNKLHGDIVICAPLISKEATSQNKLVQHHWAHITIHGILHLQGYDHIQQSDAKIMEQREITILSTLGIPNPYD
jgi:probable rRNA maturation factor